MSEFNDFGYDEVARIASQVPGTEAVIAVGGKLIIRTVAISPKTPTALIEFDPSIDGVIVPANESDN